VEKRQAVVEGGGRERATVSGLAACHCIGKSVRGVTEKPYGTIRVKRIRG
jgi:hypothetical protein